MDDILQKLAAPAPLWVTLMGIAIILMELRRIAGQLANVLHRLNRVSKHWGIDQE
jgi:hypothetical protein